jgi:3-methyladenine DNA glycosylase Mpg
LSQTQNQPEGELSLASGADRRRSQRVMIRIGVILHFTAHGKETGLRVFTANVNVHGALLVSPQNFAAGTRLVLEHKMTRERQNCRVTRTPQKVGEEFHVPVEFEKAAPDFWKIAFPPPDWKADLS